MQRWLSVGSVSLALAVAVACGKSQSGESSPSLPETAGSGGATDSGAVDSGGSGGIGGSAGEAGASDGGALDSGSDAGPACSVDGNPGQCLDPSVCGALAAHTGYTGYCADSSTAVCCAPTPDVTSNPPIPTGWKLMNQAEVTAEMTSWAVSILQDPTDYPLFATVMMTFGVLQVMVRVEWHPPDFQNGVTHRGVTLYEPA